MTTESIQAKELQGILLSEFSNQVEELTKEQIVEIIDRVKGLWFDLWEDTHKKTERDLWDKYHEEYHLNEGNLLFQCVARTPEEDGVHVVFTTSRLYPVVIEENLSFRLAVAYYGEMQDHNGEHIEVVDMGTHEQFEFHEVDKLIERFLREVAK